jgi:hypothetical protein
MVESPPCRGGSSSPGTDVSADSEVELDWESEEREFLQEMELTTRYIRGTRLVVGGWINLCRGCNAPTHRTITLEDRIKLEDRDVFCCHR